MFDDQVMADIRGLIPTMYHRDPLNTPDEEPDEELEARRRKVGIIGGVAGTGLGVAGALYKSKKHVPPPTTLQQLRTVALGYGVGMSGAWLYNAMMNPRQKEIDAVMGKEAADMSDVLNISNSYHVAAKQARIQEAKVRRWKDMYTDTAKPKAKTVKTAEQIEKDAISMAKVLPKNKLFNPIRNMYAGLYRTGRKAGAPTITRYMANHAEMIPAYAVALPAPVPMMESTTLMAPMLYSSSARKQALPALKALPQEGKNIMNYMFKKTPKANMALPSPM